MRPRLYLLALIGLALLFGSVGCASDRQQRFDTAIRSTISDLRSGDLDGANASLALARSNADGSAQRKKVEQLSILVSGADAYARGDRSSAGSTWSTASAPEFRRALSAGQSSLGVTINPLPE